MILQRFVPNRLVVRLGALAERFSALSLRERGLIAAAAVVALILVGDALFLAPLRQRLSAANARLAEQGVNLVKLQEQIGLLQGQTLDPDAANRAALAARQEELAALQARLREFDSTLVPPERAAALLENLVKSQRGLALVSLKTLAPVPLVDRSAAAKPPTEGGRAPAPTPDGVPNVFRHGLEIKVAGSYADLQGYLARLEAAPQKLLWGKLDLSVERYPRSVMTLTVYTLSLDPAWLAF